MVNIEGGLCIEGGCDYQWWDQLRGQADLGQPVSPLEKVERDRQIRKQPVLRQDELVGCSVSLSCCANYHTIGCPALKR